MSNGDFLSFIGDLTKAGLISERIEDGITYYDSTQICNSYRGKSINVIRKLAIDCFGTAMEKAAYVAVKAVCEKPMVA